MPADPPNTDPEDKDPRERGLERRSGDPSLTPWLIVGGLVLLGAAAYAISALAGS
ncbi:hypothetical protein [Brevundimonas sp. Root1279]|uniref:hypothetical protein n=1 Tax=Brevundimonas sp. Root1279 TaxID=1736443 RepID=UPI0019102C92|nr:hypothetical protein [Brevundimonas sp. Root1279]